ncbi:unnamed protein product, partial [Rotaria socialis]
MDYLLRRERLRLAKDIISQRIIEQAIDLERQCENDLRREFQSIIHDVQGIDRRRHTRSHSQTSGHRDNRQRLNTSDCYEESSSSSLSTTPPTSRNKIPFNTSNNEQRHISSKTKQQTSKHTIDNTQKRKPPVSLNNGRRISENQTLRTETRLSEQSNLQESEKKKATLLAVPQADLEKTSSEGFTADVFELPDSESLISIQSGNNRQRQNSEPHPRDFLPILSSTDPESPPPTRAPPPKRIYGPPQLSTMLSVTDNLDSPFEISTDAHEETLDKPIRQKSESLNIQQQKGGCSDSDNDNNQNENHQSNEFVQFLRSISSNVENNQNEQRLQPTSSMSMNSTRDLPNVGDGTQLLLTRLGIIR